MKRDKKWKKGLIAAAAFLLINIVAIVIISGKEVQTIDERLAAHMQDAKGQAEEVLEGYAHSFALFTEILKQEIEEHPDPDEIWTYLKGIDRQMAEIEGDTFDGLYMYYQGRYLYSWDTPYSQYEDTGYIATERPWYKAAVKGGGEVVFTPPYMSYANHYILSTIAQLQPDGETVFAYDIKMGNIQKLVSTLQAYDREELMIFDREGTIIGSTDASNLGGNLYATLAETEATLKEAEAALAEAGDISQTEREKLKETVDSAAVFHSFRQKSEKGLSLLLQNGQKATSLKIDGKAHYGYLLEGEQYNFLVLVPKGSMLAATVLNWLVPLLLLEILLIYTFGRVSKAQKDRELRQAYVELGQTQRRLELALTAAQKAAAIDDLTGMMNFKSFRKGVAENLEELGPGESGILIMMDGDHFKAVNDQYGHTMGDEVIKLCAQMIVGRIRTIDLASRLHGDEFAIFVSRTDDYAVAQRIIDDINATIGKEAKRRNMPAITMSAGAVIARQGDSYAALAKTADTALYEAKETHSGAFARASEENEI